MPQAKNYSFTSKNLNSLCNFLLSVLSQNLAVTMQVLFLFLCSCLNLSVMMYQCSKHDYQLFPNSEKHSFTMSCNKPKLLYEIFTVRWLSFVIFNFHEFHENCDS